MKHRFLNKKIIGLHGFAQVGKDSLAKILVERFGYKRFSFADPMRDALLKLNPCIETECGSTMPLAYLIERDGWDVAKVTYPEIRRLLQVFGTEVGREMMGESVWLDIAHRKMQEDASEKIVFSDLRFANEAEFLRKQGVYLVKVERPGFGPVNGHKSDAGLPVELFDFIASNDGELEHLTSIAAIIAGCAEFRFATAEV